MGKICGNFYEPSYNISIQNIDVKTPDPTVANNLFETKHRFGALISGKLLGITTHNLRILEKWAHTAQLVLLFSINLIVETTLNYGETKLWSHIHQV